MTTATITIPARLAPKLELWGKLTAEIFGAIRSEEGLVPEGTPDDQRWFWSKEWQAGEREVDEQISNGETYEFDNVLDAIKFLHDQV
jgi:hypothetical protein